MHSDDVEHRLDADSVFGGCCPHEILRRSDQLLHFNTGGGDTLDLFQEILCDMDEYMS